MLSMAQPCCLSTKDLRGHGDIVIIMACPLSDFCPSSSTLEPLLGLTFAEVFVSRIWASKGAVPTRIMPVDDFLLCAGRAFLNNTFIILG
jgi:hypothetical protein